VTWSPWIGKVRHTSELDRVIALPRRTEPLPGTERLTGLFALGDQTLWPVQAQALGELLMVGGLFAPIRVGGGKTLISFLASEMVQAKRPLLLVPAKLRDKTHREFADLQKHWRRPKVLPVILSYELLSRENHAEILYEIRPDLIIADEVHRLRNISAACTRRVGRYMNVNPGTAFVALSGTMTKRSLMDFAHIIDWCLGMGAPIPQTVYDLERWSRALDEESTWLNARLHPGALMVFAEGWGTSEEQARRGYRRRLVETYGVVATEESPIDASLVIDEWSPKGSSEAQKDALENLRLSWELPDGTELMDAVEIWRHSLEIAQGFWYKWAEEPPKEWMKARKDWAAYCRLRLKYTQKIDTEAQLKRACKGLEVLEVWEAIRPTYTPKTVPVWLTTHVVDEAAAWVKERRGLCWVSHRAIGEKMRSMHGIRYFGALGMDEGIPVESWESGCALSVAANAEGRNLQHYNENLILSPPTTGDRWEQLLGRTHRDGQRADEVSASVYLGCRQAEGGLKRALSDAKYQRGILGSPQKLLIADIVIEGIRP